MWVLSTVGYMPTDASYIYTTTFWMEKGAVNVAVKALDKAAAFSYWDGMHSAPAFSLSLPKKDSQILFHAILKEGGGRDLLLHKNKCLE